MSKPRAQFIIIDGNSLMHRAWHALPPLMTREGTLVNAVYGFAAIMLNLVKDFKPDYGAVAFDPPGKTFRHEKYDDYKATRQKQPDELYTQIPIIKEVARLFGFHIEEKEGYEADDVIGTLAEGARAAGMETIIVTGDLDALQLVDKHTKVYTLKRGINETATYDIAAVKDRFGFGPEKVVEYKSLAGDSSDNIPGVAGVGDKTARELLAKFDTLEEIYEYLEAGGGAKVKESTAKKMLAQKERAYLSRDLARICRTVPIPFNEEDLKVAPAQENELLEMFRKYEFRSLVARAREALTFIANPASAKEQGELFTSGKQADDLPFTIRKGYALLDTKTSCQNLLPKLKAAKELAVDTETDNLGALTSKLLGVSIAWEEGESCYVPAEHLSLIVPVLENKNIKKYGHNIKYDIEVLDRAGVRLGGLSFDTMLASYLLHPTGRSHSLDHLAFVELKHQMVPITDLIGPRGKKQLTLADIGVERVADYSAEDADYTLRLAHVFAKELAKEGLLKLFCDIELPLVPVLAEMEEAGVKIDIKFLGEMSKKISQEIGVLESKIHELAGAPFNVNSPLQLKGILFDKLGISTKGIGKTKTGISTAAGELEKLYDAHPIIPLIVEHRELAKLRNTYLDALPELVNKETGRVHTHFNQTVTSTGRLSSSDPNLQNIPIRTKLGRSIRKAFVPEPGNVIVAADYSQIELRIAADLSGDPTLIKIFKEGRDIHTTTAAFVHQIDEHDVTPELRRTAKEVNFGVLYGMGARGLAQRTGMEFNRAKEFIARYFEQFAGLNEYIENGIALAHSRGYVETKFGRRLYLPDIHSGVPQVAAAAERLATNMPIQGAAADIMKMAMIAIHKDLPKISPKARMLMQVHDELVFEVPKGDEDRVKIFIRETMESVTKLQVPIVAEVKSGTNWEEAH